MNIDDIKKEMDPPIAWGEDEAINEFVGRISKHGYRIVKLKTVGHAHKKQPGGRWVFHEGSPHMNDWCLYVAEEEL